MVWQKLERSRGDYLQTSQPLAGRRNKPCCQGNFLPFGASYGHHMALNLSWWCNQWPLDEYHGD